MPTPLCLIYSRPAIATLYGFAMPFDLRKQRLELITDWGYLNQAMLHRDVLIRLCQARDLLRQTDDDMPSVRQVAKEAGMSPYHFTHLFRAVFGETPKQCQL